MLPMTPPIRLRLDQAAQAAVSERYEHTRRAVERINCQIVRLAAKAATPQRPPGWYCAGRIRCGRFGSSPCLEIGHSRTSTVSVSAAATASLRNSRLTASARALSPGSGSFADAATSTSSREDIPKPRTISGRPR